MSHKKSIVIGVFCCSLVAALAFQNASPITGQWMIDRQPVEGKVGLTLHGSSGGSGHFSSSSMLPLDQLRGLTREQMGSAGAVVRFDVVRDAGTLECEGYFKNGNGSGAFTFSPNPRFISEMQSLGYSGLSAEKVFAMAVHGVTLSYVRDLRGLGLNRLSSDQLIAMRIHGVAIEYVRDMKALGFGELSPDNLVAMRIHDVSTDFARDMKTLGYSPSIDQLVTMRIHGASTDFVKEIKSLGYAPSIDELVTMRIHSVTPEYIRSLHARGMKNLTISQLVSLKIHGISD